MIKIRTIGIAVVAAAALFAAGFWAGGVRPRSGQTRDFMFQVIGLHINNQGGQTGNLFFHYRYVDGIADKDIPDYTKVRQMALDFLAKSDMSHNPYWEVLNSRLCGQLKNSYPFEAISCELQIIGNENPGPHQEPGYRASVETIGDIAPLAIPGPLTN